MLIRVGDLVDYHSVIGKEITSRGHKVESLARIHGRKVAWITGKSGCVATEALTPHVPDEPKKEGAEHAV